MLLGCDLHSIMGLKKPINILAKYGHSRNYNTIQEIETAQAELAQKLVSLQYPLPLMPIDQESKVQTIFWWDNFDVKRRLKREVYTPATELRFKKNPANLLKGMNPQRYQGQRRELFL